MIIEKISKQVANDIIECNDALNEDDIHTRLEVYFENEGIEIYGNDKLKYDISDYLFSNQKQLGLDEIIGIDNQSYLVSMKSQNNKNGA